MSNESNAETDARGMPAQIEREIDRLRSDARYAYLDGRNARYTALTRKADKLAADLRKASA